MKNINKNDGSNYTTWVIVGIIGAIFIGIKVYTKHLENKNQQYISEHYDEIQNYLQKNNSDTDIAPKETRLIFNGIDVNQSYAEVGQQLNNIYHVKYEEKFNPDVRYTSFEGSYENVPDNYIGLYRNDEDLSTDMIELYKSV